MIPQVNKEPVPNITISRLQVGEFEVPVPVGLSELLNNAGAWGLRREEPPVMKQYEKRVEMREGQLVTVLTKKK